ncbi:MAG: helix-turn-helix domain-containing protein [Clostridia bacterium]|nr:helix-turn-helix domain-containing protein [Clostridia bacterium]
MKILNFGSCNIDYVYSMDHIVAVGETQMTYKMEIFPGGKGLNQSIAAARAGVETYHAGCVGADGGMLLDILKESGVNVSCLQKVDAKNGHAIIQVSSQGENAIFLHAGSNNMVTKELIDSVLSQFDAGDILLLQNEINNVDYIIEKAYERKLCIILNPSPLNDEIDKMDFGKLSYLILNEVEATAISGCEAPEESLTYFKKQYPGLRVMLTLGSRGCIYMDEENEIYQPAYRVTAVDTTAAGDTFTGYFAAGLVMGKPYAEVLKIASAASAISVTREGAAPSIPLWDEVMEKMPNLQENTSGGKRAQQKKQIEDYIEQNIGTATPEELARMLGYSVVHTGKLVKEITGTTFSKYLQNKRCSMAAKLLVEKQMPVEEIIRTVGYENESFFRRIFKEKYGKNPLEYRKQRG